MPIAERTSTTTWTGRLASGSGTTTSGSGALGSLPVTWDARTVEPEGKTSPEELAAAAHSSCFSMALALRLGENHTPPERLVVSATVTLDEVDGVPTIVSSALTVRATVPAADQQSFERSVDEAAALCPISRLFAGAAITVDATLDA
jgi:osmotically inducible protein OsmC